MKKNGVYQGIKNSMISMAGNIFRKISLAAGAVLATVAAAGLAVALSGTDVVYADDVGGVDGGIEWTISGDTLTIKAASAPEQGWTSGYMKNYKYNSPKAPWILSTEYNSVSELVVVIEDDVKNIGNKAFGYQTDTKEFSSVTIGSGVESIGQEAFHNAHISKLVAYNTNLRYDAEDANNCSLKLDAFLSKNNGGKVYVDVDNVYCYEGSTIKYYFSAFLQESFDQVENFERRDINIYPLYVELSSVNLLDDVNDEVDFNLSIEPDTWRKAETNTNDTIPSSVLSAFIADGKDVSKLRLFSVSISDPSSPVDTVKLKVPIPGAWSQTGSVKVFAYNESDNSGITAVSSSLVDDNEYIAFDVKMNVSYALYYDYSNATPQTDITITADYFSFVYQWNIAGGSKTFNTPETPQNRDTFDKFVNTHDSRYKLDAVHLRAFDISATVDGASVSDAIANLKVSVPVPTEWESYASSVKVLTITNSAIAEVEGVDVKTIDGKKYLEFTPPHFSPYALYYANAGETPTTQPTTSAQQPTTSNGNGNNNNNNSTTSYTQATTKAPGGGLDNTPNTGVKDVMWILIPAATMLLGVGIVVLARRKKNINDNY